MYMGVGTGRVPLCSSLMRCISDKLFLEIVSISRSRSLPFVGITRTFRE